eukprot:CAMPEP_0202873674 /NCGR_PEP_ID=MMETSP1391-20130828/23728_1 /ASSEMBLY_ACC=CAM_ASM_000867 /TAXON_ID=1034604 /ORGANISM="Chlamydomonas leiostraca, Strain SAG 11-49" /LENGTH=155 /DNA_ID=CAMNT_0049554935 /DNA_START=183 /DNA_END=647 /DNA_ORIENTATION=-
MCSPVRQPAGNEHSSGSGDPMASAGPSNKEKPTQAQELDAAMKAFAAISAAVKREGPGACSDSERARLPTYEDWLCPGGGSKPSSHCKAAMVPAAAGILLLAAAAPEHGAAEGAHEADAGAAHASVSRQSEGRHEAGGAPSPRLHACAQQQPILD